MKNTEKIIFLDIDGVLNPSLHIIALNKLWEVSDKEIKSKDEFGDLFFYHNTEALKKLIETTGAKIVLSSAWRMAGLQRMQLMWEMRDLAGELIDITPDCNTVLNNSDLTYYDDICRGLEIKYWIEHNNFTGKYVIIDDTPDMLAEQQHLFIRTNQRCGLTFKDVNKAIEILNKE